MNTVELKSFIQAVKVELNSPAPGDREDIYEQLLRTALAYLEPLLPDESKVPYEGIIAAYHLALPMLTPVAKLTNTRRASLLRRWNEEPEHQSLEWWRNYFKRAARSDFLTGREQNGRSWQADFDFFLQPKSMTKIIEGAYGIGRGRTARDEFMDDVQREQDALIKAARGISE